MKHIDELLAASATIEWPEQIPDPHPQAHLECTGIDMQPVGEGRIKLTLYCSHGSVYALLAWPNAQMLATGLTELARKIQRNE
jgi:hypothetical protein